jgi:hypothetical protein
MPISMPQSRRTRESEEPMTRQPIAQRAESAAVALDMVDRREQSQNTFPIVGTAEMSASPNAARPAANDPSSPSDAETAADRFLAAHGGDARAAIAELLAAMRMLADDNRALVAACSRGFARRPPR